ncbi:hypothetical protein [Sutcliffiella horikoshii]|uniref:hypothetical protein n=1 Tax=Sutcliffiella horikoshii TaxID=79883 RepID=UPI00384CD444
MAKQDIRNLAHQMLDELEEAELSRVIHTMRLIKDQNRKESTEKNFPVAKPTKEELIAINKAKREFETGESYTHEDVFGEDYV